MTLVLRKLLASSTFAIAGADFDFQPAQNQAPHARARRIIGLQLFDGHNPAERHIWKAITLSQSQDVASQAAAIRDYLGISLDQQTAWKTE
ncbi:MAG: hypothetical protein ABTS16_03805 [Candidatus Accumulibacter phosphatis]|jgi:hypothetical protein|uniref:hypothetical protein n=1 Tax=Candidatus Accumulibacter contiguus TaxID=2954381 RepID=UPI00207BCE2F|nr:hypothetical protein [Candidatus Accumulibacter contiguus]